LTLIVFVSGGWLIFHWLGLTPFEPFGH
jgi:hypothetical protein